MKNFEKSIFLGVIVIIVIGGVIYYNHCRENNSINENTEEIYYETKEKEEEQENFIIIHITGEIKTPGIIKIKENSRLADAIEAAGGLTENADINKINLAYIISDGQKIYIPNINDKTEDYVNSEAGNGVIIENMESNNKKLVNINTATQAELETLTGIGASTALKIINYRKENGKFNNIEEIKNVSGIGEAKYEVIKNNICVR